MIRSKVNSATPDWIRVGYLTVRLNTSPSFTRTKRVISAHEQTARLLSTLGIAPLLGLILLMTATVLAEANLTTSTAAVEFTNRVWDATPLIMENPIVGVGILIAAGFPIVALHELGHAFVAFAYQKELKRIGLVLLFGVLPIFAYVEHEDITGEPAANLRIACGGIAMQALVGVLLTPAILHVFGAVPFAAEYSTLPLTHAWLATIFLLNLELALLNAIPIPVLDGGRFVHSLCLLTDYKLTGRESEDLATALTLISIAAVIAGMVVI